MDNIYILQNEIKNTLERVAIDIHATDEEKIVALHMALNTIFLLQNTRNAYMAKVEEKENKADGNSNA